MSQDGQRPEGAPRYATITEAADILKVSPRTVRAMLRDGRLTPHRLGGRVVRVDLDEIGTAAATDERAALLARIEARLARIEEQQGQFARMIQQVCPLMRQQQQQPRRQPRRVDLEVRDDTDRPKPR